MVPPVRTEDLDGKHLRIAVDRAKIEQFCEKWKVGEFYFFGSVLRDDFRPDSDVDVMVTFEDDASWGWEIVAMADELSGILGREVDLSERSAIEKSRNWIRRKAILKSAELLHARR